MAINSAKAFEQQEIEVQNYFDGKNLTNTVRTACSGMNSSSGSLCSS
jgi:hypothetical protein